jgi:hypothetical protein
MLRRAKNFCVIFIAVLLVQLGYKLSKLTYRGER